ncbi:MAG: transketolase family protein [Thermoflexales bacterium]|nr:transketolase family protein [Thermoflexales bacterium]
MEMTETRFAYGEALLELGSQRPEIVVLDADLYKSTRTVLFRDAFPERFIDVGISEADMVSTAAGMAATGLIPFCNTFAMFITSLGYLPIRTQIAYPSLGVKLVGSSAGLTQGFDGASHQSLEDVALMRILPNMAVVSPADDLETRQATFAIAGWPGPVYMRLGRYPVPRLFDAGYHFEVGKATTLRDGGDVAIFATGHMVCKALEAAELLARDRIEARVINVSTIKPLDEAAVRQAAGEVALLASVEEHSVIGGLGSAIAEYVSEFASTPPLLRLGVRDVFGESAQADELLEKHRLSAPLIADDIRRALR